MSVTNGTAQRFGDGQLAFGLKRFEDGDGNSLWRFSVMRLCGGDTLIQQDANLGELSEMVTWLKRAIEIVSTDGGRTTTAEERAP